MQQTDCVRNNTRLFDCQIKEWWITGSSVPWDETIRTRNSPVLHGPNLYGRTDSFRPTFWPCLLWLNILWHGLLSANSRAFFFCRDLTTLVSWFCLRTRLVDFIKLAYSCNRVHGQNFLFNIFANKLNNDNYTQGHCIECKICLYKLSASSSRIMSCSSASVGFWPRDLKTSPSSFVVIVPSPSLSSSENAALNSAPQYNKRTTGLSISTITAVNCYCILCSFIPNVCAFCRVNTTVVF